ncbi:hypothetical protein [Enterococcus faecalis]|uniref:Uncharacterized protein n=1 Tax=Enterococcus faecalis TaxID=1351 RepID=A0A4U3MN56_ENTFL|nr:hypothetical protein [Enterococcus faecalis]EHM3060391.1 hypothetical protein [Enterococcus faecalis]MDT2225178.1 hypothetical protein [Enterococcus faecalis]MEB7486793.1 hypothetical protein [Enterococcus faecalis]TKK89426.1 hypothetical protein EY666_04495 [Enterococcus faecalis]
MENLKNIIDYVALSIAPIAGFVISLLTYLNSQKEEKLNNQVKKQIHIENTNGNNYYYEDNRKIEVSEKISYLRESQQRLSTRQQNIDYISNSLSRFSFVFLILIYATNLWTYIYPLPNLPFPKFDNIQESIVSFVAISLYQAIIPTIKNILILIALMCLVLIVKNLFKKINFASIFSAIIYLIISIVYFLCEKVVGRIDVTRIDFSFSQIQDFFSYLKSLTPFIIVLVLIFLWTIATMLIKILFETEYTKPNYKLLKVAIPRIGFLLFLAIFPIVIIFLSNYI